MKSNLTPLRSSVILGVPFHDLTLAEVLERISLAIRHRTPRYLATANLDFAMQASRDVELQRILLEAEYVLCDGTPIVWASRWFGSPLRERVAGSDLVPQIAAEAEKRGWKIFLLGGESDVLTRAIDNLRTQHPALAVEGYSPAVAPLLEMNNDALAVRIQSAKPDILLVAFGCPKQEKWIYMNYARMGVPVSIGVGATIDFLGGKFRRAPHWMRRAGLEWTFRLLQEPRRLFKRYVLDFGFFVGAVWRERRALRHKMVAAPATPASFVPTTSVNVQKWSGEIDAAALLTGKATPLPALLPGEVLALDLSDVTFMDSAGIGHLVSLYRSRVRSGGGFVIVRPSEFVRSLLQTVKLDRLIQSVEEPSDALSVLGLRRQQPGWVADKDAVALSFVGELTVQRVPGHVNWLTSAWEARPDASRLVLDLSQVGFIDSSGLGLLVRAHKLAKARPGGSVVIRGAGLNVRNVTQLARLDSLFQFDHAHA